MSSPPSLPRALDAIASRSARIVVRDAALERLQRDVPREAVADDDVGGAARGGRAPRRSRCSAASAPLEELVRLADEPVALLRLLADREERDPRLANAERLLGEERAHVRELEQVLGAGVRVRAAVDQDASGRRAPGSGIAIAGRCTPGSRPISTRPAASSAPVFPAERATSASPSFDGAAGGEERAVALRARGVAGLLVHRDDVGRVDDLEPAGERRDLALAAVQDRFDRVGAGLERAGDDLLGRPVAAHRVDGDADGPAVSHGLRDAGVESGSTSRPAIRAAGRADAMRPLRLVALRALDDRRASRACASRAACRGGTSRSFASGRPWARRIVA